MMKQLVFALMLETLTSDGFVIETTEYGVWADISKCTFFSRSLSLQGVEGTAQSLRSCVVRGSLQE